jgi:3-oxoacyl-[acyl-carrier protein] reductase
MIDIGGRKALITGGSRGIGRSTALFFAQAGADVAINFRRHREAAEEVKRQIVKKGREGMIFKTDMAKKDQIIQMVEKIIQEWGRIDILVNNAGIWTYGEMGNMDESIWSETMSINVDSVFHTCNAVVPFMKENKEGWIVNVSSTAGVRGEAFHSHYAASKGALIALTKSLAVELAPYNIRVNCIAPGWVDTDMCAEVFRDLDFRKSIEESIPLHRIPPPEDIAGPILFLASDLARHVSGEVLNVNGASVL